MLFRTLREQAMALRLALWALRRPWGHPGDLLPEHVPGARGSGRREAKNAKFVWDVRDITWGYARDFAGPSPLMALATRVLEK